MVSSVVKVLGIVSLILILLIGGVGALANSGGGEWKFYREITINDNSGLNLKDYQILIDLSSTNFDFSKILSDGRDIRFTDASGNELSYWIEDLHTKIWVKIPFIPARGTTKIRMYYGNEHAASMSNGDATFFLFDNFDGSSIDFNKWHTVVYGSYPWRIPVVRNSEIVSSNQYDGITSNQKFLFNRAVKLRSAFSINGNNWWSWAGFIDGGSYPYALIQNYNRWWGATNMIREPTSSLEYTAFDSSLKGSYHTYELSWIQGENKYWVDGVYRATHTGQVPSSSLPIEISGTPQTDWVLVRNYVTNEPIATVNSEQTLPITYPTTSSTTYSTIYPTSIPTIPPEPGQGLWIFIVSILLVIICILLVAILIVIRRRSEK